MKLTLSVALGFALACALALPSLSDGRPPLQIVVKQLKPDLRDRIRVVVQVENLGKKPLPQLKLACTVFKDNKVLGHGSGALHDLAPGTKSIADVLVPAGALQNGLSASCRVSR